MRDLSSTAGIRIGLAAWLLPFAVMSATIEWNEPQYVAGDADVCTNGVTLYAYCGADVKPDVLRVNGVEFTTNAREYENLGGDIEYTGFHFMHGSILTDGIEVTDTFTTNYFLVLSRSQCATQSHSPVDVTLKNLTPGRKYLVQLWSASTYAKDFANQTVTIDGGKAVMIQNPDDATRMGQYVTGTFIADAETQKFRAVHSKYAIINAIQVRDLSETPAISWQVRDAAGDSDVQTDGRLLFAYTQCGEDVTLNGVTFKGVSDYHALPAAGWLADLGNTMFWFANASVFATDAFLASGALSEGYKKLLSGATYGPTSTGDGLGSLTLRNLKPGCAYLVQLWISDTRSNGKTRYVTLDGQCAVRYNTGLCGQYAIGRFRATNRDQTISLAAVDETGAPGSVQWNAMQLREIPTGVEWGEVEAIDAAGTCISTDGDLAYAYSFASETVTANGVEFSPAGDSHRKMGNKIELRSFNCSVPGPTFDFMPNTVDAGLSQEVHDILRTGSYSGFFRSTFMRLKNLAPGARYQLQLFVGDNRAETPSRYMVLDGSAHLPLATSDAFPFGATVKGEFTAKADVQDVSLVAMAAEKSSGSLSCQIQAVQLRRLSQPVVETEYWTATPVASSDDVSTDGTLLYAYGRNGAKVNGVAFASVAKSSEMPTDDVEWTNFSSQNATVFGNNISESNLGSDGSAYKSLVSGAFYNSKTSGTITLKKLTPGRRYLFQIWIVDGRSNGATRYAEVGGVKIPFKGATGCGTHAICDFKATAETKSMTFSFVDTANAASTQFNAFQVRELGMEERATVDDGSTVSGAFAGTSFVKNGACAIEFSAAAPNLTHVMLNAGTLVMSNPELVANPLDVTIGSGATLCVPSGKTLVLDGLSGDGTLAADGATIVLANAANGTFSGTITGDATLRKMDAWPYGLAGDSTGRFSILVDDGMFRLFSAGRTGTLSSIRLGSNAKLELDYAGTNAVEVLKYGNRRVSGTISGDTLPGVIYGIGALEAPYIGTRIFIR